MRKVAGLAAVLTISLGTLTACSGGNYCGELQSYAEASKNLDIKDNNAVEKMLSASEKVSKSAPDDLQDDWEVVLDYIKKAKDANGDEAKLAELGKTDGPKIASSTAAITKQAKDTCNVELDS